MTSERLPIWMHERRLIRAIESNTVVLCVAGTGVGKSTQLPQMLMNYTRKKIICSQPRRLAAVSIAERVSQELNEEVGGKIGYSVGQRSVVSERTQCTFMTCGLLLRRLKMEAERVFDDVAFLIMDEVHERSVESDLVLTCVKRLMKSNRALRRQIKIVLVSATLDANRYREYWNLGDIDDRVDLINLDEYESPDNDPTTFRHVDMRYLTNLFSFLSPSACTWNNETKIVAKSVQEIETKICANIADNDLDFGRYSLSQEFHNLVAAVIRQCYFEKIKANNEPQATLVFLPTYRSLEKQHDTLSKMTDLPNLCIEVLHSSIELESSIKSISKRNPSEMTIILATNVAESSVTIPDVYDCIDSCLTNEIAYNHEIRRGHAKVVMASISQLNQRKGRVGRTRNGRMWRLIPARLTADGGLKQYETPALKLCCLDDTVLGLAAAKSRALRLVDQVLEQTLDPPDNKNVQLTKDFLIEISAIYQQNRRITPTAYGELLASMPVSCDIARFASCLAFVTHDLRVASLLAAAKAILPKTIARPFGSLFKYSNNLARYSKKASKSIKLQIQRGATTNNATEKIDAFEDLLAHFAAFEFYQAAFIDRRRRWDPSERQAFASLNKHELLDAFALRHDLNPTALVDMEYTARTIFNCFHRHRPFWILENQQSLAKPTFLSLRDHVCILDDDHCTAPAQLTGGDALSANLLSTKNKNLIFEAFCTAFFAGSIGNESTSDDEQDQRPRCKFFASGTCRFEDWECRFSHRPLGNCRHFARGYCQFGDQCMYKHETQSLASQITSVNEAMGAQRLNEAMGAEDFLRHEQIWSRRKVAIIFPSHVQLMAKLRLLGSSSFPTFSPDFEPSKNKWLPVFPQNLNSNDLLLVIMPSPELAIDDDDNNVDDFELDDQEAADDEIRRRLKSLIQYLFGIFRQGRAYALERSGLRMDLVLRIDDFIHARIIDLAHAHFFYLDRTFLYDTDDFPFPYHSTNGGSTYFAVYSFIFIPPPSLPNCCVCLDNFSTHDQAKNNRRLDCGHYLHKTCANDLQEHNQGNDIICPLCRKQQGPNLRYQQRRTVVFHYAP